MGCLTGDRPSEEQVENLCGLVDAVTEVTIYRYVEECACAFQAGAYRAAMVAGWCAVAGYLRELVRGFGEDFAKSYWPTRDDANIRALDEWDGKGLITVCKELRYFDTQALNQLKDFWDKRCECAHPSGITVTSQEVLDHVQGAKWLLKRSLDEVHIQDARIILATVEQLGRSISREEANRLVNVLEESEITNLTLAVMKNFFIRPEDRVQDSTLRYLWDASYTMVPDQCQVHLMEKLGEELTRPRDGDIIDESIPDDTPDEVWEEILNLAADIDDVVETPQVVRLLYWSKTPQDSLIWAYLYMRWRQLNDDNKEQFCKYAPDRYRKLRCDSYFEEV